MEKVFEAKGNPITFKQVKIEVCGPLAIQGMQQTDPAQNMTLNMEITDFNQPWQKLNLVNGSTINVLGEFLLKSEKPAECMTLTYDKSSDKTYNYFSCKKCGINWVCETCKDSCH